MLLVAPAVSGCDVEEDGTDVDRLSVTALEAAEEVDEDADDESPASTNEFGTEQPTSESGLWGNCKGLDRYPEHGVYEATIVYFIDEAVPAGEEVFPPMDADRNTLEYRTEAYDFFSERYGIDFDPNDPNPQVAFDGNGGQVLVQPIKTGAGDTSTHQVYGLDAQMIPKWRHRLPVTNVALRDDGFFVFVLSDFEAHGTYGGVDGLTVRGGDLLVAGEYRVFDHKDRLLDTLEYKATTPATVNPFNGDLEASDGATFVNITCDIHSDLFGDGLVRGLGEQRPMPDGSLDLDFRYVMRFPSRLADSDLDYAKCKRVRPLW